MKIYVITKKGGKSPVKDWDGKVMIFPSKTNAKKEFYYGEFNVREADLTIGKIVK